MKLYGRSYPILPHHSHRLEETEKVVLRVVSEDNGVFISSFMPGETFSIYTLQDQLVYRGKAAYQNPPKELRLNSTNRLNKENIYLTHHYIL